MLSSNCFNTTPNGTTVISINDVINLPNTMIVDSKNMPYIDNIILLNPNITTFIFEPGNYKLINILKIKKDNIKFVGKTGISVDVQIEQINNFDGIALMANNIVLQNILVKCVHSGKQCLITASANNTVVAGCCFICADDTFGVYYAGPSDLVEGKNTLDGYFSGKLDTGNVFYNNIVYSKYSGDSVAFCLQYNSQFVGNFVRGGKVAIYMCKICNVYKNKLMNSTTNGFYVSLPSDNINIICNKIFKPAYSAIVIKNQLEHGAFESYKYDIAIKHNMIFGSMFYGIEVNNGIDIIISKNNIIAGESMGIYAYSTNRIQILNNKIAYFTFGVYLEHCEYITVKGNNIMSEFPSIGNTSIKITTDSTNIDVTNNNIQGQYKYDLITNSGINNIVSNNDITPYYTLADETSVFTII